MRGRRFGNGNRYFLILAALILGILSFGCGGGGGGSSSSGGGGVSGTPNIALSSSTMQFSNLVMGQTADKSVTVQNTGTAALNVGQITAPAVPFSIVTDACSNKSLAPNGSCAVVVRFAPTDQVSYSGTFLIPSNDADQPSLTVSLSGNGQGLNVTINQVDTSNFPSIKVVVTVADAADNPITGLQESNFTLSEEGSGMPIAIFSGTATSPVSIALDLDFSGSVASVQNDIEESAKTFLASLNPATDEAMVIKFRSETQVTIDFTPVSNLAALNAAIDAAFVSPPGTRLYDSVYESINRLALRSPANRTAAIVVSDGVDFNDQTELQLSTHSLEDVITNAKQKGVAIFTIGLGDALKPEIMQPMAVQTGGEFLRAPTSTDLNNAYLKISQILSNQYEITFTTLKSDGSVNSLTVGVTSGVLHGDDTVSVTY